MQVSMRRRSPSLLVAMAALVAVLCATMLSAQPARAQAPEAAIPLGSDGSAELLGGGAHEPRYHGRRWRKLQEALRQNSAAIRAITSGDPEPYIDLWDYSPDVTLFGAWGPIERGREAVTDTFRWVAGRFGPEGGTESEYTVIRMSGSLAYTVGFERGMVQVDGRPLAPMTIRVTQIYSYSHGDWHLMHRHADFPPADQRPDPAAR